MPLTIGTNSYVTTTEALDYLYESFRASEWNAFADVPQPPPDPSVLSSQQVALITAARLIDRQPLRGSKADSAQALAFPRDYTDGVPQDVKDAQVEVALWLLTDYLKRRRATTPTLDAANFMDEGFGGPQGTSGIKLAVEGVTVEDSAEGKKTRVTFAPATPAPVVALPTELPPAALLLLKDHLALGIALER